MSGMNFDRHADDYSARIGEAVAVFGARHDFYIRNKGGIILDLLGSTAAGARLLDVGCGLGLVHPYLVDHVAELHGVDISERSLAAARRANPAVRYAAYDGLSLPYRGGSFDCAFAINVMHHVPPENWPGFLAEMARVVRGGGQVAVIEHNPLNPATRWIVRTCPLDEGAVLVGARRLRSLFAASGLRTVTTRYVLFTPFDTPLARSVDHALARVPLGAQYVMRGFAPSSAERALQAA
jgi:SAM-dependent methyltransferase